jgi:putative transposase
LVVDTLGLLLAVVVHAADIQDRDGAKLVLGTQEALRPPHLIWADGAYAATHRVGKRVRFVDA